jgi:membrane-associated phospholipid phosphatase
MSGVILMLVLGTGASAPAQFPPETPPPPEVEEKRTGPAGVPPPVRLFPPDLPPEKLGRRDPVLRWNDVTLEAIRAAHTPPPLAARNLAMVHVAVYDAVNAIYRTHRVYRVQADPAPGSSPEAAAASAAYHVLAALYPRQREAFDAALRSSLAELPGDKSRDDGVDLGRFVAGQVVAWRRDDGSDRPGAHRPRVRPGLWRPTPAAFRDALLPGWGDVTPFAIRKGTQYCPYGPPEMTSKAYTAAFREVKLLGGRHSTARTADQTQIAYFWADGDGTVTPPGHWNQIAQAVARQRGNTLMENARLFAALNISLADAGILCWVIKFTYDFWRPVTAIQRADEDGNPDTEPDPDWAPLLETPPFPSYTSGHSTFSGAAAAVLADHFGDKVSFTVTSQGVPGATRSFRSFWAAAEEAGQSRIYGGIHYQFDNLDGLAMGRHLGRYVCRDFLQPLREAAAAPGKASDSLYRPLPER